jgi:hypothetical protein
MCSLRKTTYALLRCAPRRPADQPGAGGGCSLPGAAATRAQGTGGQPLPGPDEA